MATLTFKCYVPKSPKGKIQKPISKSVARQPSSLDKTSQIDSNGMPIEVQPALGGAASSNDWYQKVVGASETRVQDTQVFRNDLVGTRAASITEKDASDNYTNNDFPLLTHPPPPKTKHILAEERPSMKNAVEKGNDQNQGDDLFGSCGWSAPGSYDELIELGSNDKSEGDGVNLDTRHACRMVDSGKSGSDAFILEHRPILSNHIASEHDDSDISIDNTKSLLTAKRQRPCSSILPHIRTPLLPRNEDGKSSRVNIKYSNPDESGDGDSWPKRRRVSAPPDGGTAPNSRHNWSKHSPSPISEEEEDDWTLGSSANSSAASTSRTSLLSKSAPPTEPQLCRQVIDPCQNWEIRKIVGKEDIDGVLHYLVDWYPTLEPENSLGHAKEKLGEFEERLQARRQVKNRRVGPDLKQGERAVAQADALGGPQPKRPRGRPRKQT